MTGPMTGPAAPPLFVVKGEASAQEVAALVVVLQAVGAARRAQEAASRLADAQADRVSEWSAPRHRVRGRRTLPASGPGGWRASGLAQ